ncbi:hypothetical protein MBLNU13_g09322t1 [Cladosporium sp. NU13]
MERWANGLREERCAIFLGVQFSTFVVRAWELELPGGSPTPIITLAPRQNHGKDKLDVYIQNTFADGAAVKLQVRGLDIWKRHTNVCLDDKLVVEAKFVNLVSAYIPYLKDNEWMLHVL